MKNLVLFTVLWLTTALTYAQTKLVKADSYLDVRSGKLIKPANIIIEDGMIKSINPESIPDKIEVIDLYGRILQTTDNINSSSVTLPRGNLQTGIYILRIHSAKIYTKDIMIR